MKSAKSCFNKALFFKNIKRFWPVWVLYNIAWLIGMPLVLLSQLSSSYPEIVNGYVLGNALYMGVITNAIFGFVSALTLFSYLYTSRSVGAFHTLPIRREGLFLTCFLSGLCWLFVSNLFIFALSAVVELIYGALAIKYLLQWLAMVCLEGLFFYGFAVFCAFLTGHGFAHLVIYGILNFVVIIIELIIRFWTSLFCYGLSDSGSTTFDILSPIIMLFKNTNVTGRYVGILQTEPAYTGWYALILYAVAGLVYAIIALLLYRRRHSESASEFIAVPALRPVFLYFFAFIGSLVIGMIFYLAIFASSIYNPPDNSAWSILVCMTAGGFLGYFITSMLLNKSFRVFKKTGAGFIAYALVLSALVTAMEFDVFKVERYIPKLDSIFDVTISGFSSPMTFNDPEVISELMQAHKAIVENKEANEAFARENRDAYYDSFHVSILYDRRDFKQISRRYDLYDVPGVDREVLELLEDTINTPAAVADRMSRFLEWDPALLTTVEINYVGRNSNSDMDYITEYLTGEKAREFLRDFIHADLREGKLCRVPILYDPGSENAYYDCFIVFNFANEISFTIVPNVSSERTMSYLKEIGIEPRVSEHQYKLGYYTEYYLAS